MRSVFGWSLPPGVRASDFDVVDGPCEMCGNFIDQCICPECPVCKAMGLNTCYRDHGLVQVPAQRAGRQMREAEEQREREAEARMIDAAYGHQPEEQ
jgi:hypothetical protein